MNFVHWRELESVPIPAACRESQERALRRLFVQAQGFQLAGNGSKETTYGDIALNTERMFLREVERSGTVMGTYIWYFLRNLWDPASPYRDEARLNRFLIRLGRALECTKKRGPQFDWAHMDKDRQIVVRGWCDSTTVGGLDCPPLCWLTSLALWDLLGIAKVVTWKLDTRETKARTLEATLRGIGLVPLRRGKIKHVEKRVVPVWAKGKKRVVQQVEQVWVA